MPRTIVPIDYQRRLVEIGRIRLGKKVPTSNGTRPAKLDKFRLTSRDRARLEAAAALYGGTVQPWDDQHELYTDRDEIPVAVVPRQAINVAYELWGQLPLGGGKKTPVICLRRCDGTTCATTNARGELDVAGCLCAQEPEMQCKPTTRVSVILTEVPGMGVWRVESHGWNALSEMQGQVELLEALTAHAGRPIRARLRLDKRTRPTAGGTRRFVVPVIDIDHTVDQVLAALGEPAGSYPTSIDPTTVAAPRADANPNIGTAPPAAAPSIAAQLAAAAEAEAPARANAAEPFRPTGARPRTADEIAAAQAEAPDAGDAELEGAGAADAAPSSGGALPLASMVAIWIGELEAGDDYRHRFLEAFSDGAYTSAKGVPQDGETITTLKATILRVKRGAIRLTDTGNGRWRFVDNATGLPSSDPGGQSPARRGGPVDPDAEPEQQPAAASTEGLELTEAGWRKLLANVDGIGPAKLLNQARTIAGELDRPAPNGLDEITDPDVAAACVAWLGSHR